MPEYRIHRNHGPSGTRRSEWRATRPSTEASDGPPADRASARSDRDSSPVRRRRARTTGRPGAPPRSGRRGADTTATAYERRARDENSSSSADESEDSYAAPRGRFGSYRASGEEYGASCHCECHDEERRRRNDSHLLSAAQREVDMSTETRKATQRGSKNPLVAACETAGRMFDTLYDAVIEDAPTMFMRVGLKKVAKRVFHA